MNSHIVKGIVGVPTPTGLTQAAYTLRNDELLRGAAEHIQIGLNGLNIRKEEAS